MENNQATEATQPKDKKGFAIAGFVISIISLVFSPLFIVSLIFSILGLRSSKRGLAIAGLTISIIDAVLLVVLVPVILTSLGSARSEANDAVIKSELSVLRAEAEILSLDNGSYSGVCGTPLMLSIQERSGRSASCDDNRDMGLYWIAYAPLSSENYFCSDSTGFSADIGRNAPLGTTCITS